jgi:glycosyltransferase involved in cell wall biosynthesis
MDLRTRPWLVLLEQHRLRWGGDIRRHYVLSRLAARTGARVVDGWKPANVRRGLARPRGHFWTRTARVATSEFLPEATLDLVRERGVPMVLDFHDDPLRQAEALGLAANPEASEARRRNLDANVAAFRWLVAPSTPFAAFAGLDLERVIVAPNGSATDVVRPGPWPDVPTIGLVSGAGPGRGIEALVAAARLVRAEVPQVRLLLWLAATSAASERYLDELRLSLTGETWIEFGSAPYEAIGAQLARASVLVLPTPAHPYWDSVAPVKLFDAMAAARPVVTTPRVEPARIILAADAGMVADGDGPEALAAHLLSLVVDRTLAQRAGERGRAYAVANHDWAGISARLADDILRRV